MVIDTSAFIALLLGEPEADVLAQAIAAAQTRLVSSFTVLETGIVIEARKGRAGAREFDLLLHDAQIDVVPFTGEQAALARAAWTRYGKGRHPAGLNIGDCCSYALATLSTEPLLFKGNDFVQTDVAFVSYPASRGATDR
jgi:ribonuclease VapC